MEHSHDVPSHYRYVSLVGEDHDLAYKIVAHLYKANKCPCEPVVDYHSVEVRGDQGEPCVAERLHFSDFGQLPERPHVGEGVGVHDGIGSRDGTHDLEDVVLDQHKVENSISAWPRDIDLDLIRGLCLYKDRRVRVGAHGRVKYLSSGRETLEDDHYPIGRFLLPMHTLDFS